MQKNVRGLRRSAIAGPQIAQISQSQGACQKSRAGSVGFRAGDGAFAGYRTMAWYTSGWKAAATGEPG
jgi:hypothetical protein